MISLVEKRKRQVEDLCRRYRVRRLDLFGSAVEGGFDPQSSDLDFLVDFEDFRFEDAADRFLGLLVDLEDLFNRRIDLISDPDIRNPYLRRAVDSTRVNLYAA
jgi:uncharacterized protein